jgi:hypothetical protein
VPCSSDAAIRKLPNKWATWGTHESQSLHPLQATLCLRGLELLKVGGKMSYSTCSLSPIENEAVVASILQQCGDKIRLCKVELSGFRFQEGLTDWKMLNLKPAQECKVIDESNAENPDQPISYFNEYNNMDEIPETESVIRGKKHLRETMFASHYSAEIKQELTKCLRVLPHHQDTSGFFITIMEKVKDFSNQPLLNKEEANESTDLPLSIQDKKTFNYVRCDPTDPDYQYLKSYFGLTDAFDSRQLVSQDSSMNKIGFISKELSEYLYTDAYANRLSIINLGVPIFTRNHSKHMGGECIFRINQEGVINLVPYMTKRIVRTKNLTIFKRLMSLRYSNISVCCKKDDPALYEAIVKLNPGCFVLVYEVDGNGNVEALTMHKFEYAMGTMVTREGAFSL